MKVLVARTDRLGDVVLSLPAIAWLKARRPEWQLHALVAAGSVPLVEHDPHLAAVRVWPDDAAGLADERYDAALLLLYDRELAVRLRALGIRKRVGPLSKWSSWALLNRGVWQRRSHAARHERDLNGELARRLAGGAGGEWPAPRLHLSVAQHELGAAFRRRAAPEAACVVFVHPGSRGSSLTWPPRHFGVLARRLASRAGWRVFMTGGEADAPAVAAAAATAGPAVEVLAARYELREFLGVLSGGDLLVGPSTGPLHAAAALGLAAVGVYSPVPVQSMRRWGPLGPHATALAPHVRCPGRLECLGERCGLWNCVETVGVDEVEQAAVAAVGARAAERGERT